MFPRRIFSVFIGMVLFLTLFSVRGAVGQTSSRDTTVQRDSLEAERPRVKREKIEYKSEGKNDPFRPLFDDKKDERDELPLLEIDGSVLVGIMRGPGGGLALVRDTEGRTYVLREGAKINNGYLRQVKTDMAVFNISKYGRYRRVELELESEKRADSFQQGVRETVPRMKPTGKIKPVEPQQIHPASQPAGIRQVPSNGNYTLQIAAFRGENDARRLQQWLREREFETRIEDITIPESGRWYRVRYGMYDSYDAVKVMAETLRKRFDFYCWIVPIDS